MPDKDLKSVGYRIKSLRKKYDIKQKDIAEATSLNVKTISLIENGHIVPSAGVLDYLSTKHGASIDWILTGLGKPDSEKVPDSDSAAALHAKIFAMQNELSELKEMFKDLISKLDKL